MKLDDLRARLRTQEAPKPTLCGQCMARPISPGNGLCDVCERVKLDCVANARKTRNVRACIHCKGEIDADDFQLGVYCTSCLVGMLKLKSRRRSKP